MDDRIIVVTGAAGFIGSCLVRYFNDVGHTRLVLVDNLKKGDKWRNLLGKQFLDLLPKEQLFSWLTGRETEVGAFIHLGACSDTLEADGDYLIENNYRYTRRLAEYALQHGQRFIYASSAATYGNGQLGFSDDHDLLEELRPLNLYGYSKHLFDLWAYREKVLGQMVGLKFFNVFGPNEWHKGRMASMLYKMLPIVQGGETVQLFQSNDPGRFADGEQQRDFIYIKDVVRMISHFLSHPAQGIFNIGSGIPTSWNQLTRALFAACDMPEKIAYVPMPPSLSKQYQNYTCAKMEKYQKVREQGPLLTYMPADGVADCVSYLKEDKRW